MEKLPDDINTNILSRLPLRSIGQDNCVSKLWRTILSDSSFYSFRLTNFSNIEPDLLFITYDEYGLDFYYLEVSEGTPIMQKPLSKLISSSFFGYSPRLLPVILGSCNGFLCFSRYPRCNPLSYKNPIYIVNPVTQQYSPLPPFLAQVGKKTLKWFSGFGYEESTSKFKLILVLYMNSNDDGAPTPTLCNEVQVLTVGSSDWRRKVGIAPQLLYRSRSSQVSFAFVSGCLHWLTLDETSSTDTLVIVSFNLGLEEFAFVSAPDLNIVHKLYLQYSLVALEQHLALVENRFTDYTQIWIMKNYNSKASWVKQFCISHNLVHGIRCQGVEIVKLCKNGEFLLVCTIQGRRYLVYYNATSHNCRFTEVAWLPKKAKQVQVLPFVGTLISLKSAFGMEEDSAATRKGRKL